MTWDASGCDTAINHLPVIEFAFPGPVRDRIVTAILAGEKTATSSLLQEYDAPGERLPVIGDRGAVIDSRSARVGIIRVVDVRVVALGDPPSLLTPPRRRPSIRERRDGWRHRPR
ncbi:ASCH domain-containing protein [Herbiconiux sp. A18JL235]|uniref:ASCH domain-containing protein n=1 Tax=Herbiconiux sp. A18JL235 TaxID=3152363 RepID=A0AB39BE04_9MICO